MFRIILRMSCAISPKIRLGLDYFYYSGAAEGETLCATESLYTFIHYEMPLDNFLQA